MISEQLVDYVKQNMQAGFSRTQIETTLHAAGWTDTDILTAFDSISRAQAITHGTTPAREPAVTELQHSTDVEVARIQEELRTSQANTRIPGNTTETGIVGFIIKTNMASTKRGAQVLLVALSVIICGLLYVIFLR